MMLSIMFVITLFGTSMAFARGPHGGPGFGPMHGGPGGGGPGFGGPDGMGFGPHGLGPGLHWCQDPAVAEELGLTDNQIETIEDIIYEAQNRMIDLRADVERERLELQNTIQDGNFNVNTVEGQVDAMVESFAQLKKEQIMMFVEVMNVLTPEQREEIQNLRGERRGWRSGPGFGGQNNN